MSREALALKIAWRYLTAPKNYGAVNAISIISVVGVAIATAAIVIVLSVFNGFRYHLNERLDSLTADVSITPEYGKTIENGDSLAELLRNMPGVATAMEEVSDNALVIASSKEMPVKLKGVDPRVYSEITSIDSLLLDGRAITDYVSGEVSVAVGVAQRLGMYSSGDTLLMFAPKRQGRVNIANPVASFITDSVKVSSIFRSMQNEFDENTVICDISTARKLFQYEKEATSIQIKATAGTDINRLSQHIKKYLGEGYVVKDRFEQQAANFRMVEIEKWITFLLLVFILIIASFNIISTLCMFILEKGNALHTMSHLGLSKSRIGNIFWWESVLVTMFGAISGLILGVGVSLLQEKFELLKLAGDPESLLMQAYPVRVEWIDLVYTMMPILIIGIVTAYISKGFAKRELRKIN